MPLREYRCRVCGAVVEVIERPTQVLATVDDCDSCEREGTMERVLISSGSTFHLKGRGWAKDGYDKNGR